MEDYYLVDRLLSGHFRIWSYMKMSLNDIKSHVTFTFVFENKHVFMTNHMFPFLLYNRNVHRSETRLIFLISLTLLGVNAEDCFPLK